MDCAPWAVEGPGVPTAWKERKKSTSGEVEKEAEGGKRGGEGEVRKWCVTGFCEMSCQSEREVECGEPPGSLWERCM